MGAVCGYRTGNLRIVVDFGSRNEATGFTVYRLSIGKQPTLWRFLVALRPPGAHSMQCDAAIRFGQGGPARVCLYRWEYTYRETHVVHRGSVVIVAQYLNARQGSIAGRVGPN